MRRIGLTMFLVLLGLAAIAAYLTLFTVHQTQQALVLEFVDGRMKREHLTGNGFHPANLVV